MHAAPDFEFFTAIDRRRTGMLPVDDLHALYWEESGNPQDIRVAYVHGSAGGGATPENAARSMPPHCRHPARCRHASCSLIALHFIQGRKP